MLPALPTLLVSLALLAAPAAAGEPRGASRGAPARTPPNVLVILLDDWGVDRFDAYTPDSSARTPVLDAFAEQALVFDRAYSDPTCSPTRAAALTGTLGVHTGVGNGFPWFNSGSDPFTLDLRVHTPLPARLAPLGYRRFAVGKWHLTPDTLAHPDPYMHPLLAGFDAWRGLITNIVTAMPHLSYFNYEYATAQPTGVTVDPAVPPPVDPPQPKPYVTSVQVDDALELIERAGEQPWFTWLALTAPHAPWDLPPQELVGVDLATIAPGDDPARYDAVLEAADTELGRLFASIRPAVLQRTWVIVMGDNGTPGAAFDTPQLLGKKASVDEGGIHVPLMVWHPSLAPGRTDVLVHAVDLHATILELAGGTPSAPDSVSFAPLLRGEPWRPREWVYSARRVPVGFGDFCQERRAVRIDGWKLIREWNNPGLGCSTIPSPPDEFRLRRMDVPGAGDEGVAVPGPSFSPEELAALCELDAIFRSVEPGLPPLAPCGP